MFQAETMTDVRDMLVGRKVTSVNFDRDKGEFRSIALRLDDGTGVTLTATSFQSIKVESI
jgi:hypothetical protein